MTPILLMFCALTLGAFSANAQLLQGVLDGNVTDPSGAAVPGAAVKASNEQTGLIRMVETNESGSFSLPTIPAGSYQIEVSLDGFQTYRQTGVQVQTNAVARVNVVLEVGSITETVEVSAQAATLQTDRAEVRQEITETTLKNIPVPLGRNYQSLFVTLPGVSPPQNGHSVPSNPSRALQFSVNGTARSNNNTRIDGASSTNIWLPHMTGYNPALESIEQVNIVTSSFDAEQGLAGGAAINLTIKSGTNEFHGAAFEYHASQSIMAYPWNSDRTQPKPKYINNQYGGAFGGPIVKNKVFFFASYEGTRDSQYAQRFDSIGTQAMRQGDLSVVFDGCPAGADCNIYDPMSGGNNGANRTPFANARIPLSRFDPGIQKLVSDPRYPEVNQVGIGAFGLTRNYLAGGSTQFFRDTLDTKFNFNLTDKLSSFVRFSMLDFRMNNPQAFGELGGPNLSGALGNPGRGFGNTYSGTLSATYVVNPNLVLDGYYGYTLVDSNVEQALLGENLGSTYLGIPGLESSRRIDGGWPRLRIDSFSEFGITNNFMPYFRTDPQSQYVLNGNWTKGKHNVRFGTDIYFQALNHNQPEFSGSIGPASGGFRFRANQTRLNAATDSRATDINPFASFLLGVYEDAGKIQQFDEDGYKTRTQLWSFYVRDRWQITPKLTMSYGLRHEIYPFPTRDGGRGLERFIMDDTSGLAPGAAPNDIVICGVGNQPQNCGITVGRQMTVPRVGLAYRFKDDMVFRAGYGITVDPFNWARPMRTNYPIMEVFNIDAASFNVGGTLRDGLPIIREPDTSSGVIRLPSAAAVNFFDNTNAVRGYIQSWNAAVEKRFGNWIGNVSYVATRSVNQLAALEQNWAPIGTGNAGRQLNNATFGKKTVQARNHGSLGTSKYDALQATLQHRFSKGYQVNFAYTWSHTRAYTNQDSAAGTQGFGIPWEYRRNYGPADLDIRHNFQYNGIFESPFGKGKKWLTSGPGSWVLGGWQFNNLLSLRTGQPFTITGNGGELNAPGSSQVADCIGEPNRIGVTGGSGVFYDTAAFAQPVGARFGTCGINTLPGPGLFNLDIGLFRRFTLTEKVNLQFRAEGFNMTNTPHFSNPNGDVTSGNFMLATGIANTGRDGIDQRFFRFGLRLGW